MLYLFWGNVPPFFLFLQVVLFFSAKTWGGTQCLKFFSEIVWYSYLVVVCMYVQQQYITFFLALCPPCKGANGAFQFPSDALFNHHSSTKLGGRGIKLIFATPPFFRHVFLVMAERFFSWIFNFFDDGVGHLFLLFFLHHSLFTQYKKLNQSRQSFFFLLFLKSYFPFFKRQASILCVLGEIFTLFYRKDHRSSQKNPFPT